MRSCAIAIGESWCGRRNIDRASQALALMRRGERMTLRNAARSCHSEARAAQPRNPGSGNPVARFTRYETEGQREEARA